MWDSNWCEHECEDGMDKGTVNKAHIYENGQNQESVEESDIAMLPRFFHQETVGNRLVMHRFESPAISMMIVWVVVMSVTMTVVACCRCIAVKDTVWSDAEKHESGEYIAV